MHLMK